MHIPRSELRQILQEMLVDNQYLPERMNEWQMLEVDNFISCYLTRCTVDSVREIFLESDTGANPEEMYLYTMAETKVIKQKILIYVAPAVIGPIAEILVELRAEDVKERQAEHDYSRAVRP